MGNSACSKSSTNEGQKQSKKEGGRFSRKKSPSNSNPKTDSKKKNEPQNDKSQAAEATHHIEVDLAEVVKKAMELNMAQAEENKVLKQQAAESKKRHQMERDHLEKHLMMKNKVLEEENKDLKQQNAEARDDIKVWRDMFANQRSNDEKPAPNHFMKREREHLVEQMEDMKEQIKQQHREIQAAEEKLGEVQTECDFFREKLQEVTQLPDNLLGRQGSYNFDVDEMCKENRYLRELLKHMEHEKVTCGKCKEGNQEMRGKQGGPHTSDITRIRRTNEVNAMLSQKGAQSLPATKKSISELQSLCGSFIDAILDKDMFLKHQRKTIKILGTRVNELEIKLKTLDIIQR